MKLKEKRREGGRIVRLYDEPQTLLTRVLASQQVTSEQKRQLRAQRQQLNPFALRQEIERQRKQIERVWRLVAH